MYLKLFDSLQHRVDATNVYYPMNTLMFLINEFITVLTQGRNVLKCSNIETCS